MKTFKLFIVLIPMLAFIGCKDENNKQTKVIEEVNKYVNALKTNQYEDRYLPAFTYEHIDELFKYRNEKDIITNFLRNPISSLYQEECELGMYVLWTVEYIRIKFVDSDLLIIEKFPSMNPILKLRASEKLELVYDVEAYQIASDAYNTWWTSNKDKSVGEIMKIDPLENTIYKWH